VETASSRPRLPGHAAHPQRGRYDLYDLICDIPIRWSRAQQFWRRGTHDRRMALWFTELKEDAIREIAGRLRSKGIKSVAVCLLHAYKYRKHEQRIAALLREESPAYRRAGIGHPVDGRSRCRRADRPQAPGSRRPSGGRHREGEPDSSRDRPTARAISII